MSSSLSLAFRRDRSAQYLPSMNSPGLDGTSSTRYHPAPSRNEIAVVQPVLVSYGLYFRQGATISTLHSDQASRGRTPNNLTIPPA